ncbi:hypothetical protein L208DRAFT_1378830 [Tricholoma matsutake]|nr:hypothetical protein L208DRAFT_1378830 [Tricholoma matsutake 945]
MGVTFKSSVVTATEAAEVDAIGCMPAIAGFGDVQNSTNSLLREAFERLDGPQDASMWRRRDALGISDLSHTKGMQEWCYERVPEWRRYPLRRNVWSLSKSTYQHQQSI